MTAAGRGPHRPRLLQGIADLGRGRARAGRRLARVRPTTRSCSARWPTAARARSRRSTRPAAGRGSTTTVRDPLGRPDRRALAASADGTRGRDRDGRGVGAVAPGRRRARRRWRPRSVGTGDLMRAALDAGRDRRSSSGIGGSATTDGGAGLLDGARRARVDRDAGRRRTSPALDRRLAERRPCQVACDVDATRCSGPTGAAAVYGPQKGAEPEQVGRPRRPTRRASPTRWTPRAGRPSARPRVPARPAASATRCCAISDRLRSFALRPGVDLVMEATDFDARLGRADLVITGEGRIDAQTAFGKTALGVARRAADGGRAVHRRRRRRRAGGHRGAGRGRGRRRARSSSGRRPSRRRWPPAAGRSSAVASGWRRLDRPSRERRAPVQRRHRAAPAEAAPAASGEFPTRVRAMAKRLERYRPGARRRSSSTRSQNATGGRPGSADSTRRAS